jgi:rhomboid protease GluP
MNPGDEADSPPDDPTSRPAAGDGRPESAPPTPEQVLRWVAASGAEPWFPSAHAQETGVARDSLDRPLNELREGELVRVVTWVRGLGQGYALTPDGQTALNNTAALERLRALIPDGDTAEMPATGPETDQATTRSAVTDMRPPLVTPAMLVASAAWFAVGLLVAVRAGVPTGRYLWSGDPTVLHRLGAVTAADLVNGEWWRLATCCFVHFGLLHLIGNLIALGMMGPLAELLWGRGRVLVVYAVSGLAGSCLAMALHPLQPNGGPVMLAGASGAVWGVLMSLVAWLLLFRPYLPGPVAADLSRRFALVFALNVGVSFLPGVSWEAHLGGGVAGFAAAGLLNAARFGGRARRVWVLVALGLLPVACVGGLVGMVKSGARWEPVRQRAAARAGAAREEAARRHAAEQADAFNREVVPLLDALAPAAVRPAEQQAASLLLRDPRKRNPDVLAVVQVRLQALRLAAADAEAKSSGPPTGVEAFDLLLGMLDANAIPDEPAWQAWGEARREADRLWEELAAR